ncbi:MAG TPA: hypothetical protein VKP66_11175, partial [Steroidobacteraceae bacterium]|nr:hypothetical protein [Steroidobacteraceae bacterium]
PNWPGIFRTAVNHRCFNFGGQATGARRTVLLVCCLAAAGIALGQDDWSTTRESFLCKSDSEVREIKTYISPDGDLAGAVGCRVDYIKNGTTQTIWSSRSNRSYCNGKAAQLAAKLERSHFSCSPLRLQQSDEG